MSSPAMTPVVVLQEPPRIDEPRFGFYHGLGLAVVVHLLLLLLVHTYPGIISGAVWKLTPEESPVPPIRFTFIDVPDDNVVEENPDADLISDKNREESGETPRETTPDGKNPPSEGNTPEKVAGGGPPPAPRMPEPAQQMPRTPPPQPEPPRPQEEQQPEPAAEKPAEAPPKGREVADGSGPGGLPEGAEDGSDEQPKEKQKDFSKALKELNAPLPLDLQAISPPSSSEPPAPLPGSDTQWKFDNTNPSFPVNVGNLSFDSKGADFGPWLREFHSRVLAEWRRQIDAWSEDVRRNISSSRFLSEGEKAYRHAYQMSRIAGVTGINFVVTREGSVVFLEIVHRSGTEGLDRSVHKTLRNVILPELPPDYPDEELPIQAGFYFNVKPPK